MGTGTEHEFELTALQAYLHFGHDITYYAQNFSAADFEVPLGPKTTRHLKYPFMPHEKYLAAGPYIITADLRYRRTSMTERELDMGEIDEDEYRVKVLEHNVNLGSAT